MTAAAAVPVRRRLWTTLPLFGALTVAPIVRQHRRHLRLTSRGCSTARSRGRTTSTRRSSSSPACRACWRRRWSARPWPLPAWCCRRCSAIRWRRRSPSGCRPGAALGAMLAIALQLDLGVLGSLVGAARELRRLGGAMRIVYGLATSQRRGLSTNVLLLAGVTLNSFFSALILFVQYLGRLRRDVPHGAVADGRPRRRQLRRRSWPRCR